MSVSIDAVPPHPPVQFSPFDRFLRGAGLNLLLVIVSGLVMSFTFPPREAWWLGWVGLAPLLVALRRTTAVRAAGWLMLLFGIVFLGVTLAWLATIFSISVVGICVLASLPWLLFALAYRVAGGWTPGVLAALLAPVLWLAAEWVRCEGWYFQFSWGQFGYALASCRRGGALFPFIGVYGVTFLIVLVNALLAEIVLSRALWSRRVLAAAPVLIAGTVLSLWLNVPTGMPPSPIAADRAFRTAIVQSESGDLDTLLSRTRALANMHPQLVVWPEYAVIDYPLAKPEIMAKLSGLACELHCTLVLGCKDHVPADIPVDWLRRRAMTSLAGELFHNTALVIAPDGTLVGTYHKTHPIQFFSDGVPGREFPTFPTPVGRLGIAICYDFDYAATALKLTRNGAEVLLVPTYDSQEWGDTQHIQHARMALARAAETDRWVIRATSSGVSQIITPDGKTAAFIPNQPEGAVVTLAMPRATKTPYVAWTHWLVDVCIWLSLGWAMLMLGTVIRRWIRRRQEDGMPVAGSRNIACAGE